MTMAPTRSRPSAARIDAIHYPESDGKPIADNTLQFERIMTIKGGIAAEFAHDPNVFVAGDLLWYPVEGDNRTRVAPDTMVAFGRPQGYRGSYLQWLEDDIAPQVVFEVLSPGNRAAEMRTKLDFYELHGVEEYYEEDPYKNILRGWQRDAQGYLRPIDRMDGWVSPRLGITFLVTSGEPIQMRHSSGELFQTFQELHDDRDDQRRARDREREARLRAEQSRQLADQARQLADQARQLAEDETREKQQTIERLAARLRALGVAPEDL